MTKIPEGLYYSEHDEWVRVEGNEAVMGVSDYAQDSLSDIVYLELPDVGDVLAAGETMGVVESVKAASEIYAPVSGEVVAVNDDLVDAPEQINEDPYGVAWMVRLRMSDSSELDELMNASAYETYRDDRG